LVLNKIREELGQRIDQVYINIGGIHIFTASSQGSVVVSRADQKISPEDINRVIQDAQVFSLSPNREIISVYPIEFTVDGESNIKEPLGMHGMKLGVKILALGVFSPYLKNLTDAVLNSGVQILDIVPSPIAASKAVLTPQQKELGVAVIDIGSGTTDLAVYEEGDLIHTAIFPFGSSNITNDIAIGLRTEHDVAEKIKEQFGACIFRSGKRNEKIRLPDQPDPLVFSSKSLSKIIGARTSEMFNQINKEFRKISRQGLLPAGVVLTGGGAKLSGIVEFAKKELKLPAKIGIPQTDNLEEDPSYSVAWGLILSGIEEHSRENVPSFGQGIISKLRKTFKIFLP